MHASNKTVIEDEEEDDVFSQRPFYTVVAPVDVIGCRRPTGGVFVCMLQTRVTLTAFPIATPRGRSSKFPRKGIVNMHKVFIRQNVSTLIEHIYNKIYSIFLSNHLCKYNDLFLEVMRQLFHKSILCGEKL